MNYTKKVVIALLTLFFESAAQQLAPAMGKEMAQPPQSALKKAVAGAAAAPKQEANYGSGIDTLDVESSGNWLQKRVIWEDAQRKYEKIQEAQQKALEARVSFFEKRSNSDKTLNLFYNEIGFSQGELDEILDTLLAAIDKSKQDGGLTDKEREIQAKLFEKKNELEQLKADVKSMTELDAALDTALMQLVNQITLTGDYQRQAWQKFKDIGQELDDRKAKEYYSHMDAAAKNIEAIETYIKGPLGQYFDNVLSKINELMSSIKSRLDTLRKSGIELKNQLTELEQAAQQKTEVTKKPSKSWFDTISIVWTYPASLLMRLWNWVTSLIWGARK